MIEMSKSGLRESMQTGYRLFQELLSELDEEQMTRPGAVGKWSVQDTVAHIVVHEQRMIQWITQRLCGEHPLMFQPYSLPDEDLDRLNQQIYQEQLGRSLDDVMHDLDRTHVAALRLVETSAEDDILDPNRFQLQGGEPLWEAVAANTFWHYEEHSRDIRRCLLKT